MAVIGIGKGMEQGAEMAKRIQSAVEKLSKPTELTREMKDIFMEADEPVIYGKLSTYDREGNLVYETPYPVRQFCVGQFEKDKKCMADTAEQMVFPAEISKGIGEVVSNAVNSALGDGVIPAIRNGRIVKPTTVNTLGTQWEIRKEDFDQPELKGKNRSGYCFPAAKQIVVEDLDTDDDWKNESKEVKKKHASAIMRHEVVHAFLYESGLFGDSTGSEAWATNEEMVDWIAIQFPKMYKVFAELDIL